MRLISLPSSCLPSQGVDRWLNQSLTPLSVLSSLEGPERAPGTPQEGTSSRLASQLPLPWQHWAEGPRENYHLGLPCTAQHLGVSRMRVRGPVRTDAVVRARKNRDHGEGGTEMDQTKMERGRRQEGEKGTIKNSCAGSREGGSWPGGAGARDPAHVAQPGPAPSVVQLPHSGPYHEVSPALRLWENKWCPR